jgi:hypothetical protein
MYRGGVLILFPCELRGKIRERRRRRMMKRKRGTAG